MPSLRAKCRAHTRCMGGAQVLRAPGILLEGEGHNLALSTNKHNLGCAQRSVTYHVVEASTICGMFNESLFVRADTHYRKL